MNLSRSRMARFAFISVAALASAATCLGSAAFAGSIEVTSSKFPDKVFHLTPVTDAQGDLEAFTYYADGDAPESMSLAQLRGGVSLVEFHGINVITLSIDRNFSAQHGGMVTIGYYRNVALHRKVALSIDFVREGADWSAYEVTSFYRNGTHEHADQPFTHMDFIPARLGVSWIKTW